MKTAIKNTVNSLCNLLNYSIFVGINLTTAQHSTAQHSTAQHSTAQHSTAQHSTAQHTQHSTIIIPYILKILKTSCRALVRQGVFWFALLGTPKGRVKSDKWLMMNGKFLMMNGKFLMMNG